jgi:hypothetical protein
MSGQILLGQVRRFYVMLKHVGIVQFGLGYVKTL